MSDANRDSNRVTTLIGTDINGVIRNAAIDGVTGRLRIVIGATASPTAQIFSIAKRDDNRVPAKICVMSNGKIQGILTDADRNLFVSM